MNRTLRYPWPDLRSDYLRSVIGMAICLTPTVAGVGLTPAVWVILACAALFAIYLFRTVLKQLTRIEIDDQKIYAANLGSITITWDSLSQLRLSYYTTWRKGGEGWMQLRLRGSGLTIRIDSTIAEFKEIVSRGLVAAGRNRLSLSETTVKNIASLGLVVPEWDDDQQEKEGAA